MRFSDHFKIDPGEPDWNDPVLSIDTPLFVDPFLIFDNEKGVFEGAHDELTAYFIHALERIAKSEGRRGSPIWNTVERLMLFPEVEEFCLGYSEGKTAGQGSGKGFANAITTALWTAVEQGLRNLDHFEQVQLFRERIGRDRISDTTGNILRHRFADYTTEICDRFGVPTTEFRYDRAVFDFDLGRWRNGRFFLPENAYNGHAILLVPKEFLRDLPSINKDDFWDYCVNNEDKMMREMFGEAILSRADAAKIVSIALDHPDIRARYIAYREEKGSDPYDGLNDPKGFLRWYQETKQYVTSHPMEIKIETEDQFYELIEKFIDIFANYVENKKGWTLLWNDGGTAKPEDAVQNLFLGIVKHYCDANNIDISKEANIGRGPVDFKFSNGATFKALLEVKLVNNTKFWNGFEKQLPKYLQSEAAKQGYFLPVILRDQDVDKIIDIEKRIKTASKNTGFSIKHREIDARRAPPSASKL